MKSHYSKKLAYTLSILLSVAMVASVLAKTSDLVPDNNRHTQGLIRRKMNIFSKNLTQYKKLYKRYKKYRAGKLSSEKEKALFQELRSLRKKVIITGAVVTALLTSAAGVRYFLYPSINKESLMNAGILGTITFSNSDEEVPNQTLTPEQKRWHEEQIEKEKRDKEKEERQLEQRKKRNSQDLKEKQERERKKDQERQEEKERLERESAEREQLEQLEKKRKEEKRRQKEEIQRKKQEEQQQREKERAKEERRLQELRPITDLKGSIRLKLGLFERKINEKGLKVPSQIETWQQILDNKEANSTLEQLQNMIQKIDKFIQSSYSFLRELENLEQKNKNLYESNYIKSSINSAKEQYEQGDIDRARAIISDAKSQLQ